MSKEQTKSSLGEGFLALLRIAIGWHFLYEGIVKLMDPAWSAGNYLLHATGPLASLYRSLAENDSVLYLVSQLNTWALILIGAALLLGLFTRAAALSGIALLALYFGAYIPLPGATGGVPTEGHYLLVNNTLIELIALAVVAVFPGRMWGLDGLVDRIRRRPDSEESLAKAGNSDGDDYSRRDLLKNLAPIPIAGAFAYAFHRRLRFVSNEDRILASEIMPGKDPATVPVDAISGATRKFEWTRLEALKGPLPMAKICDLQLSRMILGGNLIGGWAHARDLIYVSKLVKAYHTREKLFETLRLAEACGVNAILTNPKLCPAINDYWENGGGKIKFISDCGGKDVLVMVKQSIDNGAAACYVQGQTADRLVSQGNFDLIAKCLDVIRDNGLPAGIGGHYLETIQGCVDQGFEPDFWMKTLHHTNYWSAQAETEKDNIYCRKPDEVIAFMESLPQPWIAFKTLAAGAITPKDGFRYAFENGADFICVGMYDFQIVDDCNIVLNVLDSIHDRKRPWSA